MERNGHVKSEWETSKGGPARRRYYVTEAGEMYLNFWVEGIKQYQQMMNAFFRLYSRRGTDVGVAHQAHRDET